MYEIYDRHLFESKMGATFELFQPILVPRALVLPGLTEVKGLETKLVGQGMALSMRTWSEVILTLNVKEKTKKLQGFFFSVNQGHK